MSFGGTVNVQTGCGAPIQGVLRGFIPLCKASEALSSQSLPWSAELGMAGAVAPLPLYNFMVCGGFWRSEMWRWVVRWEVPDAAEGRTAFSRVEWTQNSFFLFLLLSCSRSNWLLRMKAILSFETSGNINDATSHARRPESLITLLGIPEHSHLYLSYSHLRAVWCVALCCWHCRYWQWLHVALCCGHCRYWQ